MRIVQPFPARADYYDRNLQTVFMHAYYTGVVPHSPTIWASYVVPDNRIAILESLFMEWEREYSATTPGRIEIQLLHGRPGNYDMVVHSRAFVSNDINRPVYDIVTGLGYILPGYGIAFSTSDTSNGGTCNYRVTAKLLLFDK